MLAERLQKVAQKKIRRLVVSMPPRHGKSFLGSKCLPAFILAHEPAARIMVLSYGAELAEEISYDIPFRASHDPVVKFAFLLNEKCPQQLSAAACSYLRKLDLAVR